MPQDTNRHVGQGPDLARPPLGAERAPRLLIVAGHDSSGRAGVDADREAALALGARPDVVITARTIQDEGGLRELGARAPAEWLAEARAALARGPRGLKLGLLPGRAQLEAAATLVAELRALCGGRPVVFDPVVAASSGARFLDEDALSALRGGVLPEGLVWTPNVPEAALLSGSDAAELARDPSARESAARRILALGAHAVLVTGGHAEGDPVRDLLCERERPTRWIERPRVCGPGLGGGGCRFASALAAGLAAGRDLEPAARAAGDLVARMLARAGSGAGRGL